MRWTIRSFQSRWPLSAVGNRYGVCLILQQSGVEVTVIEMLDEILGGMDKELSAMLRAEYAKRGIKFMLDTKVVATVRSCVRKWRHAADTGKL